ncbi:MAG: response regulator transcription factor [Chloroflexi bacterium]|nr:response regulator transcription factor [Chloroflexota bacterium]
MEDLRVLIVDDQTLMRQGLQTLLEMQPGIRVVGQAGDGIDALAQADALKPDVVLMDVRMPHMDGVQATRQIRARLPNTQVIILTTFDDDEYVFEGLRAGAMGYLLKDTSVEILADALRRVARGEALIEPSIARKVVAEFTRLGAKESRAEASEARPALPDALSEREMEILCALARGLSNREIAEQFVITEGTVKNHVSNILAKMGVRDRTQAVLKAKELGWV